MLSMYVFDFCLRTLIFIDIIIFYTCENGEMYITCSYACLLNVMLMYCFNKCWQYKLYSFILFLPYYFSNEGKNKFKTIIHKYKKMVIS